MRCVTQLSPVPVALAATLPHRKYYNLEAYERERAIKAAKHGKTVQVRGPRGSKQQQA